MRPAATVAWLMTGCALLPFPTFAQSVGAADDQTMAAMAAADASSTDDTTDTDATTTPATAATAVAAKDAAKPATADTTGAIDALPGDPATDDPAIDEDFGRLNLRETTVDGLKTQSDIGRDGAPGIRIGTFVLKPALTETFNHETTKTGTSKESRSFLETGLKGSLTSDWSRHQLTITGEGLWQHNISGIGETKPSANIDAELRLDLSDDTTGTLRAGYNFSREDSTDPNAISNATVQSGVNQYTLGAGIERDFGILRGSAKVDLERYAYGNVELDDGTAVSNEDRNRNAGTLTGRIGYELSPALIPFLEASAGKSVYELRKDTFGYQRSYQNYAARAGVEVDLGEKVNGEIALGYETYRFDDDRLKDLNGLTLDGILHWSPMRGTDITYGIATGIEPSTTAGESGALTYALSSGMTRELRSNLVARLSNSLTFRKYPSGSSQDQRVWAAGASLSWDFTRSLALTGDVSYERTTQDTGPASSITRIGVGLTLRR